VNSNQLSHRRRRHATFGEREERGGCKVCFFLNRGVDQSRYCICYEWVVVGVVVVIEQRIEWSIE
jgi:hypothetical protein